MFHVGAHSIKIIFKKSDLTLPLFSQSKPATGYFCIASYQNRQVRNCFLFLKLVELTLQLKK